VPPNDTSCSTERLSLDQWSSFWGPLQGDAQDLPVAPKFTEDWKLGKPDIVVKMPTAYDIPAEGRDIYRNFAFALDIPKGKYIKAAEYRPSNRRVVHHAQLCVDVTGRARQQDEADPAPGFDGAGSPPGQLFPGSMATWTPGIGISTGRFTTSTQPR
jgi:hypothetical protein